MVVVGVVVGVAVGVVFVSDVGVVFGGVLVLLVLLSLKAQAQQRESQSLSPFAQLSELLDDMTPWI